MSAPFRECPACGAHLDAGEACDCKETPATERTAAETARLDPPERAYYGRIVSVDLVRGGEIEPTFCVPAKKQ